MIVLPSVLSRRAMASSTAAHILGLGDRRPRRFRWRRLDVAEDRPPAPEAPQPRQADTQDEKVRFTRVPSVIRLAGAAGDHGRLRLPLGCYEL